MYIAQRKRKENIAEYILYLWQLEDLLRALQFSPEAIYSQLVQKSELDEAKKQEVFFWYMDLVNLLRKEGKEENGHLEHTLHLIDDLDNLHKQLLTLPVGEKYRALYAAVAPEIPTLKSKLGKQDISDVELFFRALYAVMLYRIKGDRSKENDIRNVIGLTSGRYVCFMRADVSCIRAFLFPEPPLPMQPMEVCSYRNCKLSDQ